MVTALQWMDLWHSLPSLIGLPYSCPHFSGSKQFAYKDLVARQWPTRSTCMHAWQCMHNNAIYGESILARPKIWGCYTHDFPNEFSIGQWNMPLRSNVNQFTSYCKEQWKLPSTTAWSTVVLHEPQGPSPIICSAVYINQIQSKARKVPTKSQIPAVKL